MKHTPGPWEVKCFPYEFPKIFHNSEVIAATRMGDFEANALLIAAAPELLEACKEALEYIQMSQGHTEAYEANLLKQAIAKAEGRDEG